MRLAAIILLFSLNASAQMFGFTGRKEIFNWSSQTWNPVINVGTHSGTTVIQGKKFSNLDGGTNYGSAIAVLGGGGMYEVKNCSFINTAGEAIQFENFGDGVGDTIWIHDNFFGNNKNGVYLYGCNAVVIIENNQCINPHGARGGKGQFFQSSTTTIRPGNAIRFNRIKGWWGEIYSEDLISSFNTSGTAGSPFLIYKNITDGGGPSASGGGFIAGDKDGQYIRIEGNVWKNPGNYVGSVAGGGNVVVWNNIGWQETWEYSNNIGQYTYITNESTFCSSITMTNNRIGLQKGSNYYCYCTPNCGDVVGINESEGSADNGWRATNYDNVTVDTIDRFIPNPMITFIPEDDLWKIRDSSTIWRHETGGEGWISPGANGAWPPSPFRPTANAGADDATTNTNYTLVGSSNGTSPSYRWVQVSGPARVTMASANSTSNVINGMTVNGAYVFRFESYVGSGGHQSSDADWVTITKN